MKVAQLQLNVNEDKQANLDRVHAALEQIRAEAVDVVCLSEMFNCPYDTANFPSYAEAAGGPSWQALSALASTFGCYLIGGSIPEIADGLIYNTCFVFDRQGREIGRYRKMHLFDIDIKGKLRFKESDVLSPGDRITVVDTEFGKVGVGICYDIRFPELIRLMTLAGAQVVFIPGAYNLITGPAHWELLFRARALDNQIYLFGTAPACDPDRGYQSWGHSLMVSPWGEVIQQIGDQEEVMINIVDFDRQREIREELPLLDHRRRDVYDLSLRC
jgi:omega-amidase